MRNICDALGIVALKPIHSRWSHLLPGW